MKKSSVGGAGRIAWRAAIGLAVAGALGAQAQSLTRAFPSFPAGLSNKIKYVIIIYPENHSFDSLYGYFPGANGLANATDYTQYGANTGTALASLIQPTTAGMSLISTAPDTRIPAGLPNQPYNVAPYVPDVYCIGDMTHLFYLEQYQINNPIYSWISGDPKNAGGPLMSKFSAWGSNPGLSLYNYDEQNSGEGAIAKQFVLADNTFHSAFGGSYLNHQWLIAARTPVWPASITDGSGASPAPGSAATTPEDPNDNYASGSGVWWPAANGAGNGVSSKTLSDNALTADPTLPGFPFSNANTNLNAGDYWSVNTIRPLQGPAGGYAVPASGPYLNIPQQNFGTAPQTNSSGTSDVMVPAPTSSTAVSGRLPLQYYDTIGDRLNAAGVSWAWFSGGWDNAKNGQADFLFQFHHQPFAFFAKYALKTAPVYPANGSTTAPIPGVDSTDPNNMPVGYGIGSKNHLLDEDKDFYPMLNSGTLPAVSFLKPIGEDNSHPGYASVKRGQAWVANVVSQIEHSSIWPNTVVFIMYDEHGGAWDHVVPPVIDRWGPGLRVPFIIASPWSKKGFVDHNQYETVSMLSFIEGLYNLPPLNTRDANAVPPVAALLGQPDLFVETHAGQPVSYQVPAYNNPVTYTVTGGSLGGLSLNGSTGLITGTPVGVSGSHTTASVTVYGSTAGLPPGQQNLVKYNIQVDVN